MSGCFGLAGLARAWCGWPLALAFATLPSLAAAACGVFGSAASHPLYGTSKLTLEAGTVSNGTLSNPMVTGDIGKALVASTGARLNPSPAPALPSLLPATFPANSASNDSTATSLSPGSYDTVTVNTTLSLAAGTYYIKKLELKDDASVVFGAGVYYIGELKIGKRTSSTISSGVVRLNIGSKVQIEDDSAMNVGGNPASLQMFLYPGADADIKKRFAAALLIYAPDAASKVEMDDGVVLAGAVIGTEVKLKVGASVTFTPATAAALAAVSTCTINTVDHYELWAPASGLACMASTVSVMACANASSPCTSAATTVGGQTATLAASAGALGTTTVTFNTAGVATTTLSHPAASNGTGIAVTLGGESANASNPRKCCTNGSSCSVANSCPVTFNSAGFIIAAAANSAATTLPSQTAGTASGSYVLRAVQTSTTTQACEAALSGTTNVNWSTTCNNPSTCSAGNLMTVAGNSSVAVAGNPNSGGAASTAVSMSFDGNGNAPFSFNYADVGQVTLVANKSAGGALLSALAGASNAFVVKPASFAVAGIKQTAAPQLVNPGAASATGAKFIQAGESFTASVTAQTSGGATTPNYGRETSPEGVLLTHTLVQPAGGASGTLANAGVAGGGFTSGIASVTNLSWSEVGIITVTPSVADGDYLGAGNVSGTSTGNIGRFVPAQFVLSGGVVTHRSGLACAPASTFSYLGENFSLGFTLTAQNTAGATTANYTGSFAKLDLTALAGWNLRGIDGSTVFAAANGRLALASASGSWTNGVAANTAITAAAPRAAAPEAPFTIQLGIAPVDSDGVAMASFNLATAPPAAADRSLLGSAVTRYGRLRLSNSFGSENASLQMPVQAQYWSGNAWVQNSADSCSSVPSAAVVRASYLDNKGAATAVWTSSASAITIAAGNGTLTLGAPTPTTTGSVDVALNLGATATDQSCLAAHPASSAGALPWLRSQNGACSALWDRDPSARASFGIYTPETRKTVHVRELF